MKTCPEWCAIESDGTEHPLPCECPACRGVGDATRCDIEVEITGARGVAIGVLASVFLLALAGAVGAAIRHVYAVREAQVREARHQQQLRDAGAAQGPTIFLDD